MKKIILLAIFAITNFLAWNYIGLLFIVNIIIIFNLVEFLKTKNWKYTLLIGFFLFLLFNISATFWLVNVDEHYSIYAFITNSILMLFVFSLIIYIAKRTNNYILYFTIIWVFSEWLLSKWDLAWPWLNFGNVLSNQFYLIKWYSITGAYGGTVWLILIGYLCFKITRRQNTTKNLIYIILLSILPIHSIINYNIDENKSKNETKVLLYNPIENGEKNNYTKIKRLYNYIYSKKTPDIILTHELLFTELYPNQIQNGDISFFIKKIIQLKPKTKLYIGTEINNSTLIKFNGVTLITKEKILFRTKKKYVPITEFTTKILRPYFGETYYSKNEIDDDIEIKNTLRIYPFVCYESVFPGFFAEKSINTKLIFISTSEAFLNKSEYGTTQYLNMIRMRAIENGRYIIKCSNDGISCLIDPNGKIVKIINKEFQSINIPEINTNTTYQKIISYL